MKECVAATPEVEKVFQGSIFEDFVAFVKAESMTRQVPEFTLSQALLTLYSASMGTASMVFMKGFDQPNVIWMTVVQPSGTRKSNVIKAAKKIWEDSCTVNSLWYNHPAMEPYQIDIFDDGTFTQAGVHKKLMANPRLIYFCDERVQLREGAQGGAQNNGTNSGFGDFLKFYEGSPSCKTLASGSERSQPTRFNIIASTQPEEAHRQATDIRFVDSGFQARFGHIISKGRYIKMAGRVWSRTVVSKSGTAAADLAYIQRKCGSNDGIFVVLSTSNGSREAFAQAADMWEEARADYSRGNAQPAIIGKASGVCQRLIVAHTAIGFASAVRRQLVGHDVPRMVTYGDLSDAEKEDYFCLDPLKAYEDSAISIFPVQIDEQGRPNPDSDSNGAGQVAAASPTDASASPSLGDVPLREDTPVLIASKETVLSAIANTRVIINHNLLVAGLSPSYKSTQNPLLRNTGMPSWISSNEMRRAAKFILTSEHCRGKIVDRSGLMRNHGLLAKNIDEVIPFMEQVKIIGIQQVAVGGRKRAMVARIERKDLDPNNQLQMDFLFAIGVDPMGYIADNGDASNEQATLVTQPVNLENYGPF